MGITQQIGASSLIKPGVIDNAAARPASPFEGQCIFQKDTDQLLVWNGTAWVIPNSPAQNPQGLELVTTCTATFTGGTAGSVSNGAVTIGTANTAITVSNAFSEIYDNYRIVYNGGAMSNATAISLQLGANASGVFGSLIYNDYLTSTVVGVGDNNSANFTYFGAGDSSNAGGIMDLLGPQRTHRTRVIAGPMHYANFFGTYTGILQNNTQYTAFTVYPFTGTITGGTIRVYGYRNS
jgi:hypothetical protein